MGWRYGHCLSILLFAMAAVGAIAQPANDRAGEFLAEVRAEFLAAVALAREGVVTSGQDSEALRAYPLYRYLQAERIGAALGAAVETWTVADADAERFVSYYDGEPVSIPVRYAWLASLARREQWPRFLENYRADAVDERLYCQYLAARVEMEQIDGLVPLVIAQWLTPRQIAGECEPVFQWLRAEGALSDTHIEQRIRLLLGARETSFARVIAQRLSPERAAPFLRWAALLERPAEEFDAYLAMPTDTVAAEALLDGWARFSRNEPAAALARYPILIETLGLNRTGASPYALSLALGLAWDRRAEAVDVFADVAASEIDDYALQWWVRAALWAGDWDLAAGKIMAMSEPLRATARWRYWAARAAQARGDRESARALYESVLAEDNVYSGFAAAQLRRRLRPNLELLPRVPARIAALAERPAFIRARELRVAKLPVAALREWRQAFESLDAESQRQAIHLAADWHWYDLAVATATRFEIFNDYRLLYPMPYAEAVREAERTTGVDAELLYAVMRQESLYRADAVSSAGARGLMQLQPGTAALAQRHLGESGAGRADLFAPSANIRLGAAALGSLLARYERNLAVALAAYNAGANAAERWLPGETVAADIWVENIPFNETREYVGRVLWHTLVFRWLGSGRTQSTRAWLEPVGPSQ